MKLLIGSKVASNEHAALIYDGITHIAVRCFPEEARINMRDSLGA